MKIVESLCHVMNVQSASDPTNMSFVLTPLANELHRVSSSDANAFDVRSVTNILDSIHVVVRSLRMKTDNSGGVGGGGGGGVHPLVSAVSTMWPMFERVATYIGMSASITDQIEIMMEKLCKFCFIYFLFQNLFVLATSSWTLFSTFFYTKHNVQNLLFWSLPSNIFITSQSYTYIYKLSSWTTLFFFLLFFFLHFFFYYIPTYISRSCV